MLSFQLRGLEETKVTIQLLISSGLTSLQFASIQPPHQMCHQHDVNDIILSQYASFPFPTMYSELLRLLLLHLIRNSFIIILN